MKNQSNLFENKVAIVTGAAHGIGRVIASQFAVAGARVVLSDIQDEMGEKNARMINKSGHNAKYFGADLRIEQEIHALIEYTAEIYQGIDILIHSARPRLRRLPFAESLDDWDLALDVFLRAPALLAKYALPYLTQSDSGNIITISSVNSSFIALHQPAAYHVAKAGLEQLTRYMAADFGNQGIRVNCICPGLVDLYDENQPLTSDPNNRIITENVVPLRRAALAEEIANVAMFLCSDSAAYINGEIRNVDGGEMLLDHFYLARKTYNLGLNKQNDNEQKE